MRLLLRSRLKRRGTPRAAGAARACCKSKQKRAASAEAKAECSDLQAQVQIRARLCQRLRVLAAGQAAEVDVVVCGAQLHNAGANHAGEDGT